MAFKERFKDKTSIVGKNGENAGLIAQPEAPRPRKTQAPVVAETPPPPAAPSAQPTKAMMAANRASVPMGGGQLNQQQQHHSVSPPRRGPSPTKHVKVVTPQPLGMMPGGGGAPLGGMPVGGAPPHAPAKQFGGKKLGVMPGVAPTMAMQPGGGGAPPPGMGRGGGGIGMNKPMGGPNGRGGGGGMMPPGGGGAPMGMGGGMVSPGRGGLGGMPSQGRGGGMGAPPGRGGMGMVPGGAMMEGMGQAMAGKYNYGGAQDFPTGQPKRSPSVKKEEKERPAFGRRANSNPDPDKPKPRPSTEPIKEPSNYKPYSVEDYKRIQEQTVGAQRKSKGVGLGPSDTDEQRLGRILRKKAQEFADASNRVNMAVLAAEGTRNTIPEGGQPMSKELQEKNERRLKALEFSRKVPKPRVRDDSDVSSLNPSGLQQPRGGALPGRTSIVDANGDGGGGYAGAEPNEEMLMELEEKHRRDQEMIEAIKKQLKM